MRDKSNKRMWGDAEEPQPQAFGGVLDLGLRLTSTAKVYIITLDLEMGTVYSQWISDFYRVGI